MYDIEKDLEQIYWVVIDEIEKQNQRNGGEGYDSLRDILTVALNASDAVKQLKELQHRYKELETMYFQQGLNYAQYHREAEERIKEQQRILDGLAEAYKTICDQYSHKDLYEHKDSWYNKASPPKQKD